MPAGLPSVSSGVPFLLYFVSGICMALSSSCDARACLLCSCSESTDLIWKTTVTGCCGDQNAVKAGQCSCIADQCGVSSTLPLCRATCM